ncbi:MAG: hypothetical protein WC130_04985 [Kiritimatiellia bacterium]
MKHLVWITIDHSQKPAEIKCGRCNQAANLPLDLPLGQPSEIMRAFLGVHNGCAAAVALPVHRLRGAKPD